MLTLSNTQKEAFSGSTVRPVVAAQLSIGQSSWGTSGAVSAGADVLTDGDQAWDADAYAGGTLTIVELGSVIKGTYTIVSNTATTVTVSTGTLSPAASHSGLEYVVRTAEVTHLFTSSIDHALDGVNGAFLMDMRSVASTIDPFTRQFSRNGFELVFADDVFLRTLVSTYQLKNMSFKVFLGTNTLQFSDYLQLDECVITDFRFEGSVIIFDVMTAYFSLLRGYTFSGVFLNEHPFDVLRALFTKSGVPTSVYDESSITPSSWAELGHWNVSRFNFPKYTSDSALTLELDQNGVVTSRPKPPFNVDGTATHEKASDLIDDLGRLLQGTFIPNDSGVYVFSRYDSSNSAVRTLTTDDISDFSQISGADGIAAQVTFRLGGGKENGEFEFTIYNQSVRSTTSNYSGASSGTTVDLSFDLEWLHPVGYLRSAQENELNYITSSDTKMRLVCGGLMGFCGLRFDQEQGPRAFYEIPAARRLSSTNYSYLLLVNEGNAYSGGAGTGPVSRGRDEIVRISNATSDLAGTDYEWKPWNGEKDMSMYQNEDGTTPWYPGADNGAYMFFDTTADNGGRGQFGTTQVAYWRENVLCYDVTLAVQAAQNILDRSKNGLPRLRFRLGLEHSDLQPGDFVNIIHSQVLFFGCNGSDANIKWEVIKAEPAPLEDSPGIWIEVAYVDGVSSGLPAIPAPDYRIPPRAIPPDGTNLDTEDDPLTQNDLTVITDSDLEIMYAG